MTLFYWLGDVLRLASLAALIAVCVLSVREIWRAVARVPRVRARSMCGGCGYAVEGLSSLSCPECGANLLEAGVVSRAAEMRRRSRPVWAVLGLGFLVYVAGSFVVTVILVFAWQRQAARGGSQTTVATLTAPTGSAFIDSIEYEHTVTWGVPIQAPGGGTYSQGQQDPIVLVVSFKQFREGLTIEVDPTGQTLTATTEGGEVLVEDEAFSLGAMRRVFGAHGVDASIATTAANIDDLARVADFSMSGISLSQVRLSSLTIGIVRTSGTGSGAALGSGMDPGKAMMIAGGVGFVVWVMGSWMILRKRRRLMREEGVR